MNRFVKARVTAEFTQVPNVIITDGRLTGSSLRLLLALYSLPKDWIVTLSGMAGRFGMTRSAVSAGMKKLKELGYVTVTCERDETGMFSYRYVLCDLEDKADKLEKAAAWEIKKPVKSKKKTQPVDNFSEADNSIPVRPVTDLTVSEKPVTDSVHTTNNVLTNTESKNTVLTNIDRCPDGFCENLSVSDGDEYSKESFCFGKTENEIRNSQCAMHNRERGSEWGATQKRLPQMGFVRDTAACGRRRCQANNVQRSEFEVAVSNEQITGTANGTGDQGSHLVWLRKVNLSTGECEHSLRGASAEKNTVYSEAPHEGESDPFSLNLRSSQLPRKGSLRVPKDTTYKTAEPSVSYSAIKSRVMEGLDYDVAKVRFDFTDDVVNLIAEELSSPDEYIKIGGRRYPAETVKDRLSQIKCTHLEYIDLALSEKKNRIKNPKSYLLSMLFNAPATINTYFGNRVRVDALREA